MVKGNSEEIERGYLANRIKGINEFLNSLKELNEEKLRELDFYRPSWKEYWMIQAKVTASRSTCLSRPTGAVVVRQNRRLATGYNGAHAGKSDCLSELACFRRKENLDEGFKKYDNCRSMHAERNALLFAGGINAKGSDLYCTLHPCIDCSKEMVACGIVRVFYEIEYESKNKERDEDWAKHLIDNGVEIESVTLSQNAKLKTIEAIINPTSARRLAPTD